MQLVRQAEVSFILVLHRKDGRKGEMAKSRKINKRGNSE